MSILSARATSRASAREVACTADGGRTMADLGRGQRARVVDVSADADAAAVRRLCDLGFVPGAEVELVRRAPLADPAVYRVAGCEFALRREQASWVSVAALEGVSLNS